MNGYNDGFDECSSSSNEDEEYDDSGDEYVSQQSPQQEQSWGFKETMKDCRESYSDVSGISEFIDAGIGLGCAMAGGAVELAK